LGLGLQNIVPNQQFMPNNANMLLQGQPRNGIAKFHASNGEKKGAMRRACIPILCFAYTLGQPWGTM
jgi:hypothetical protein